MFLTVNATFISSFVIDMKFQIPTCYFEVSQTLAF